MHELTRKLPFVNRNEGTNSSGVSASHLHIRAACPCRFCTHQNHPVEDCCICRRQFKPGLFTLIHLDTSCAIVWNCARQGRAGPRRADLIVGRHRAAPALFLSSGGSSVHRSLSGRHNKWFKKRMLFRSFSNHSLNIPDLKTKPALTETWLQEGL